MKIVSWNCNGGLRRKLKDADSLGADLLLIQECENPALISGLYRQWAGDYLWAGTDKNRGIGVFPRNGTRVTALEWQGTFSIGGFKRPHQSQSWSTSDLKLFFPFRINDTLWDKPDRWWSHSTVIAELGQLKIYSLYHHSTGEAQGHEAEPTFYLHRNRQKPYHIDYAFASGDLLNSASIAIGQADNWLHASDHMPVIVSLKGLGALSPSETV